MVPCLIGCVPVPLRPPPAKGKIVIIFGVRPVDSVSSRGPSARIHSLITTIGDTIGDQATCLHGRPR